MDLGVICESLSGSPEPWVLAGKGLDILGGYSVKAV
jgi:hypothetical protein